MEKSSLMNWIFSLFRTGFLLPMLLAKINFKIDFCRLKIQFVELDFSKFKYRSTGGLYDCTSVRQKESRCSRVHSLNIYESAGLFHNFVSVSACAEVM